MKCRTKLGVIVLALAMRPSLCAEARAQQVWAEDGGALAPIVIPADPLPAEAFAAQELQKYLKMVTSAEFEIRPGLKERPPHAIVLAVLDRPSVVSLLPADLSKGIRLDGYRWKSTGETLYIVAQEPFGVVFGIYEYLRQKAGVVFLEHADWGEEVPPQAIAAHANFSHQPLDELRNPRLAIRGLIGFGNVNKRIDWMAKNGLNCLEGIAWKPRLWPELKKRGMQFEQGPHTFQQLLRVDRYGKEHPEYFALIGGKRVADRPRQLMWCLSNPELQEEVVRKLIRQADQSPPSVVPSLGLMPSDGGQPLCQCDGCRAWMQGAKGKNEKMYGYLRFANEMARRVAQAHPGRSVSILAYADIASPPHNLRPAKNVRVMLCPYHRCARHALDDPNCSRNKEMFYQPLQQWLKITPQRWVYFYEYYMGMSSWVSLPYPTLTSMFSEWDRLIAQGVKGAVVMSSSGHLGVYGINYVAFARLGWDNPPTLDQYLKEYCSALYGKAAEPVEAIFRLWEEAMQKEEHVTPDASKYAHKVFTPEVLGRWEELLNQARAAAKTDKVRWRLDRMAIIHRYTKMVVQVTPLAERYQELNAKERAQGRQMVEDLIKFADGELKSHTDLLCLFNEHDLGHTWGRRLSSFQEPGAEEQK